ncbi:MAG: FAD-binding oxidoreductase [Rhodobacteraceae bacterium]|nr:FAD-binding oxidoreductase [Paracoccaceae bacterium]
MAVSSLTDALIAQLSSDHPNIRISAAEPRHLEEPRGRYAGQSGWVAYPASTEEVAALLRFAQAHGIGVVPYGGGTGLVGGQVVEDGARPLIIALDRMAKVRAVNATENVIIAEGGATLAQVQDAAEAENRLFPLSIASEGTARMGGILATNAGGTAVLRYGNTRDLCLGVEAVMPDGQIYHGLSRLRKDNTGYDLRHLLLGSEGTLGIITAASMKLFARPARHAVAMLAVPSPAAALALLALARDVVGEAVSAFELIHRQGYDFLAQTLPDVRVPWDVVPEWSVLIDLGLSGPGSDASGDALLEQLFERGMEAGLVLDGLLAQSDTQAQDMWTVREHIPEANRLIGSVSSHDISVPLGAIPEFIDTANARIAALGAFRINCFGHVGDGNLHYNVFPMPGFSRADNLAERDQIKRVVHDLVHELGGSVSAEHGVGRLKVDDLERYGDPVKLHAMRAIKAALDPQGIMNPGAILRVPAGA